MASRSAELLVGVPIYNGERYLRKALDSLLGQTFGDYQILVSDNASTDGTPDILAEYVKLDRRIRVVRQPVTTVPRENFLFLLREAHAPLFMWAACDDEWSPEFMQLHVEAHRRDPSLALAFCHYHYTDPDGHPVGPMRAPDYTGASAAARLSKLCTQWDDAIFYGVFRRSALDGLEFPVWWPPNAGNPLDVSYPPLFYALSRGGYALVGERPLWFNRRHSAKPYSDNTFDSGILRELGAYLLRNANLEYEVCKHVYRGSRSALLAASVLPALNFRLSRLVSWHLAYTAFATGRAALRRTLAK